MRNKSQDHKESRFGPGSFRPEVSCDVLLFIEFPRLFDEAPPPWRFYQGAQLNIYLAGFLNNASDKYTVWVIRYTV